jgi:hypothetical protein
MKQFLTALAMLVLIFSTNSLRAQSGPPAPGNGIYAIIDTTYQVGTFTQGVSHARITLKNTTATKYTAVQFRVFYDKNAFSGATVSLVGSTTNLDLQYLTNTANGFVTITLVYTGSSSTYTLADGERFDITFTHVAGASFFALPSISNLTWSGVQTYNQYAASQIGLDTTLALHSYGGQWYQPHLSYHGTFTNTTGTPAKNLKLALEKKVKTGSTWSQHAVYTTNLSGNFSFNEIIDTTYYDVRLAIKGDTMNVGNVISSADAQLINQWVLGGATPSGWDFYTGDVNESDNLTITDAYGVFGRISGRFNAWPNNTKDIKFFTVAEKNTITGSPSTNYTSSITGVTNFYFNILPGQPDSVTFYVLVPGDANGTGYHMARLTPITILPDPDPNYPSAMENVIDMSVEYDFPTSTMEVNMPSIKVNEGNLVEIPVTLKTNGKDISALQLGMLYDQELLEFKELQNSDKSMFWMSSLNPMDGMVDWIGYDPSVDKKYMIPDNYNIFTLKFIAKKPQGEWATAPLYTTNKFSGDNNSKDMTIFPTNSILVVAKMATINNESDHMILYPNPTTGDFNINFTVKEKGNVKLYVVGMNGSVEKVILDKVMPAGTYTYSSNIENVVNGIYIATLQSHNQTEGLKVIKQK